MPQQLVLAEEKAFVFFVEQFVAMPASDQLGCDQVVGHNVGVFWKLAVAFLFQRGDAAFSDGSSAKPLDWHQLQKFLTLSLAIFRPTMSAPVELPSPSDSELVNDASLWMGAAIRLTDR